MCRVVYRLPEKRAWLGILGPFYYYAERIDLLSSVFVFCAMINGRSVFVLSFVFLRKNNKINVF